MQNGKNNEPGFHPVILAPGPLPLINLSGGYNPEALAGGQWGVGGYAEPRPGMYTSAIFGGRRYIHMGIDFWAPAGTPVYSFCVGRILFWRDNNNPLDYGPTIVTEHLIDIRQPLTPLERGLNDGASAGFRAAKAGGNASETDELAALAGEVGSKRMIYALYGHLSRSSLEGLREGSAIRAGDRIGELGTAGENGGWVPHLHFQLSLKKPLEPDMPGVVAPEDLQEALEMYPDPAIFLGG